MDQAIHKYLPNLKLRFKKIVLRGLSLSLKSSYSFKGGELGGIPFLFIKVKNENIGTWDIKKHSQIFTQKINLPQIWFFESLHFHMAHTLIKNGINFIVGQTQIHLPDIGISLRNMNEKVQVLNKDLNGLAINILIRQMIKNDLSGFTKAELADIFETTRMSMVRALERILGNNLCHEIKRGVSKIIEFKSKEEIWDFFKKIIPSPIKQEVYFAEDIKGYPDSGITALSQESMLTGEKIKVISVFRKEFNKKFLKKELVLKEFAKTKVEVWDRVPMYIENNRINIIDLYLTLKDEGDERIKIELEKLLSQFELTLGNIND